MEKLKLNHFSQSLQSVNLGANVINVVVGGRELKKLD